MKNPDSTAMIRAREAEVGTVAIDAGQAAIRTVIAAAPAEHDEGSGRGLDALLAMQLAEVVTRALALAGYEIKRRK